jgi:hypothetical protein
VAELSGESGQQGGCARRHRQRVGVADEELGMRDEHAIGQEIANGSLCFPKMGGPAGSCSLQVAAPQFQTVVVDATVTFTDTAGCGCGGATLEPSVVALYPMRL